MVKVKNGGSKIFLMSGQWLRAGETLEVPEDQARFLAKLNPHITVIEPQTKKKRK